jgi:hypothetical protein
MFRQPSIGVQQHRPLRRVEEDRVLERQVEPMARPAQNLLVVGVPVFVPKEERLHPRTRQRELQLVRAVCRVHIHQRRPGPRATHVHHHPLDAVGRPQAHAVATPNAQRPKPARHAIGRGAQLRPRQPLLLVARSHRQPIREAIRRALQQVANRQFQQRPCRPPRIALGANLLVNIHGNCGHSSAFISTMKGQCTPPEWPNK